MHRKEKLAHNKQKKLGEEMWRKMYDRKRNERIKTTCENGYF